MTPTEVIRELRAEADTAESFNRWGDALEQAMRGPVAISRVNTTGGNAGTAWHAAPVDPTLSLPLLADGTKLYTLPPDQSAEIERLKAELATCNMQPEIERLKAKCDRYMDRYDAQQADIERLQTDINAGAKDYCALMERHDAQHVEIERCRKDAERMQKALVGLLNCPAIADENFTDPEWGDSETAEAEAFARAALAAMEGRP